jgi:TonB family protein
MRNIKSGLINLCSLIAVCSLYSANAHAQEPLLPCDEQEQEVLEATAEDEVQLITAFTPATPLKRIDPKYPVSAARKGAEGWVEISFVVDENGKVIDPIIEDAGGHRAFKKAAMNAVKRWQYKPAKKDGKPTQMCNQKVMLDFTIGNQGATRKFVKKYKVADELVKNRDIAGAEDAINALHAMENLNRYENAWLWNIDAIYAGQIKDDVRQLNSIQRLVASSRTHEDNIFGDSHMGAMYQRLAILEVMKARYADAIDTIETIKSLTNGEELLAGLANVSSHIEKISESDQNIAVNITLEDGSYYFHKLLRNKFAFANINGELNKVEVWCDSKREIFTVAEEHIWIVPESWGQCRVLVKGEKNTKFDLIEVGKV